MKRSLTVSVVGLLALCIAGAVGFWRYSATTKVATSETNPIEAALKNLDSTSQVERIRDTGIPGLKEVFLRTKTGGDEIVYMTEDGRKMIYGEMVDLKDRSSDTRRAVMERRTEIVRNVANLGTIRYAAPTHKKTVYVFTDPSSEFSQAMHRDMAKLNAAGLTVEYLAFPREGSAGSGYATLSRIWCASNRAAAMEAAMRGQAVDGNACNSLVDRHVEVARRLGVNGTPVLVADDGRQFSGYPGADKVLATLGLIDTGAVEPKTVTAAPGSKG